MEVGRVGGREGGREGERGRGKKGKEDSWKEREEKRGKEGEGGLQILVPYMYIDLFRLSWKKYIYKSDT